MDKPAAARITAFLRERISNLVDPRSLCQALRGASLGSLWKYRVGDHRVIADIQDAQVMVLVVRVGNRKVVYR